MIVVDTNIIAYLYLESSFSAEAETMLEIDPIWSAPSLWKSEFRNILALYIRKKFVSYIDAYQIMKKAEELISNNEYLVESSKVLELVSLSSCSAYDCEFVSLAKELDIPLITEDKKILKEFPKYSKSISSFLKSQIIN